MSRIIAVNSFRRGTGKSFLSANLGVLLALAGHRTALIDLDVPAPSTQVLFNLAEGETPHTLTEYLLGLCAIEEAAVDVTRRLAIPGEGRLYVIPSSLNPSKIAKVLRQDYDVERLHDALEQLITGLHLDVLLVDTRAGISDDTLLMLSISYSLAIVMRTDKRDFQGTGVTIDVARRLGVPHLALIVNQVPPAFEPAIVEAEVVRTFGCDVSAVLPYNARLAALGSDGIFVQHYPDDPLTGRLWNLMVELNGLEANPFEVP